MSDMFEKKSSGAARREKRTLEQEKATKKSRRKVIIIVSVFLLLFVLALLINSNFIRRTLPVVTIGDISFSAAEFEYFYVSEYEDYMNFMSQLLGMGITVNIPDPNIPLTAQVHDIESGETWADFFVNAAINRLSAMVSLYKAAQEAGFELSEEEIADIDDEIAFLGFQAQFGGFPSLDRLLAQMFGAGMNQQVFHDIQVFIRTANSYSEYMLDSFSYSAQELREYFDANKFELGFENDGDYYVTSMRQILLLRDHTDQFAFPLGEDDPEYLAEKEAAIEALQLRAQYVYDLFVESGATEQVLLDMLHEHSDEATEGGFYDNIGLELYRGSTITIIQVVPEIEEWLFYEGREVGDFSLIYTEFGYHLVFFTGYGEKFYALVADDSMRVADHESWLLSLTAYEADTHFGFFLVNL